MDGWGQVRGQGGSKKQSATVYLSILAVNHVLILLLCYFIIFTNCIVLIYQWHWVWLKQFSNITLITDFLKPLLSWIFDIIYCCIPSFSEREWPAKKQNPVMWKEYLVEACVISWLMNIFMFQQFLLLSRSTELWMSLWISWMLILFVSTYSWLLFSKLLSPFISLSFSLFLFSQWGDPPTPNHS